MSHGVSPPSLRLDTLGERQNTHAFSRKATEGVGHRRSERRDAWFAHSRGIGRRLDDCHLDQGHFLHADCPVLIEIGLIGLAINAQRDLAKERGPKRKANAAFDLSADNVGVDRNTAINGAPDLVDTRKSIIAKRDFGNLGDIGSKTFNRSDAECSPRSGFGSRPGGHFGDPVEYTLETGLILTNQFDPALDWILAAQLKQFVEKAFDGKSGVA